MGGLVWCFLVRVTERASEVPLGCARAASGWKTVPRAAREATKTTIRINCFSSEFLGRIFLWQVAERKARAVPGLSIVEMNGSVSAELEVQLGACDEELVFVIAKPGSENGLHRSYGWGEGPDLTVEDVIVVIVDADP